MRLLGRSAALRESPSTERGVTLIEMMVVVIIIGLLTASALFLLRGRPGIEQAATDLANKIREGSRKGVSGGVVDQTQTDPETVSGVPRAARARVAIVWNGTRQVVTVETRDETQPTANEWFEVSRTVLSQDVGIVSFVPELVLNQSDLGASLGTGAGSGTALSNTPVDLASSVNSAPALTFKELYFFPDGSSDGMADDPASAVTLFLLYTSGEQERRMRIVLLPLQSSPVILSGW